MVSYYSNMYISLKLPISELYRVISEYDNLIELVYYWDTTIDQMPMADDIFEYSSDDSLFILRASVGLEDKNWSIAFDVDQDGEVDSSDALTALRASVKLGSVHYNISKLYPLYDVSKYGVPFCFYSCGTA